MKDAKANDEANESQMLLDIDIGDIIAEVEKDGDVNEGEKEALATAKAALAEEVKEEAAPAKAKAAPAKAEVEKEQNQTLKQKSLKVVDKGPGFDSIGDTKPPGDASPKSTFGKLISMVRGNTLTVNKTGNKYALKSTP